MYRDSFSAYLQYDVNKDFVVDLDDHWKEIGYSQKHKAVEAIEKNFEVDVDFSDNKFALLSGKANKTTSSRGGNNIKKIYLTVNAFKNLGMLAGTNEGREIRKYFVAIEEVSQVILKRQLEQQDQEKQELTNQVRQLQIKSNEQANELENLKKTKKYVEIEKTGCNYTLKTDSLDFYRNGMSRNKDCKNRVSSHQTSNEQEIEVLHEFKTSCPKLLESCIHYALESYRSNSGREFFKCKLDHIVNIVDIIGHVLDTCRSSSENITRQELIEKFLEKSEFTGEITETTQGELRLRTKTEESVLEKLEFDGIVPKSDLREWLIKHIIRSDDGKVQLKDIVEFYTGRTKIHSSESNKIKIQIELRENFKLQNNLMLTSSYKKPDGLKQTFRGWKGFILLT